MTDTLAEKHTHPRDAHVTFYEQGHVYEIDGSSEGITSVTTLVKQFARPFDADKVIRKIRAGKHYGPGHKYYGLTDDEIKTQWKTTGEDAATQGTHMHAQIEAVYNGEEVDEDTPEFDLFRAFLADHVHLTPYRTEWVVYDEELRIAGSIDMVFQNADGTLSIYDWKRSKEIKRSGFDKMRFPLDHLYDANFVHYSLQLNIYRYLLESRYGADVRDLFLVVLHPDQRAYQKIACLDLRNEVQDLMELRRLQIRDAP